MTPFDRLSVALDCMEEDVRRIERLRFIEALNESRKPCDCAPWLVSEGNTAHATDCPFPIERDFHERVLKALAMTGEPPVGAGRRAPLGNTDGSPAFAETTGQRSLTGDGVRT